jgi:hypothetical protein
MRARWSISLLLAAAGSAIAAEKIAPKTLQFLGETTISGHVQSSFQYTFDHHGSPGQAGGRQFNNSGTSFGIDQAKVTLERPLDEADFAAGYRVDFLAGRDAERIHSFGLFSDNDNELARRRGDDGEAVDLEQAYVAFRVPVGNGLDVKFGKFVSPAGAEAIDAPANWLYSRSYIFSFGEPFSLTGALLSYRWNEVLDTQLGIVNGWDAVEDNNSAKTFLGRVGLTLFDGKLKNAVTVIGGPEQTSNNSDYRWIVDNVLTWQPPMENLTLTLNGLYGHEDGTIDSGGFRHGGGFTWWGASLMARYQWTPVVAMALRFEYFSDADGARTDGANGLRTLIGPEPPPSAAFSSLGGVDYQAVTWAVWLDRIWQNFTPRLEVRWDRANGAVMRAQPEGGAFRDGDHTQVTVSLDGIYVF